MDAPEIKVVGRLPRITVYRGGRIVDERSNISHGKHIEGIQNK